MQKETILVTGAGGQIGTVLTAALRRHYGTDHIIATDIRAPAQPDGPFLVLDVLDREALMAVVREHQVTQIYHLAAILSARGEQNPQWAWEVNMSGLFNVLEAARETGCRLFCPSSIAVCGGATPRVAMPQDAVLQPETVYGISKVAGEQWCAYYHAKYGVDVRAVRYPGIIGYQSMPGGGTTDYAVDIFHYALRGQPYPCFLSENARLPMMYMDDAVRAAMAIMQAPAASIRIRTAYNISGTNFTPAELAAAIQKHLPDFEIYYEPDFRQQIAESWPESIADAEARADWGWQSRYGLPEITADMLKHLSAAHSLITEK